MSQLAKLEPNELAKHDQIVRDYPPRLYEPRGLEREGNRRPSLCRY